MFKKEIPPLFDLGGGGLDLGLGVVRLDFCSYLFCPMVWDLHMTNYDYVHTHIHNILLTRVFFSFFFFFLFNLVTGLPFLSRPPKNKAVAEIRKEFGKGMWPKDYYHENFKYRALHHLIVFSLFFFSVCVKCNI